MRIGLIRSGKGCDLRAVSVLRTVGRRRASRPVVAIPPPRANLVSWGVNVMIGEPSPRDRLVSRMERIGEGAHSVERIEDVGWIGEDLLLLRLGMIDLVGGETFMRWLVFDCSRAEVEYLIHDLRLPDGSVVTVVPSTDETQVWLQCVRLVSGSEGLCQAESPDGAVLELHRVPLDRLLCRKPSLASLFGPLTCLCAPTASMLTAGERERLHAGELTLVEDVQMKADGTVSLLTLLGSQRAADGGTQVQRLYELSMDPAGNWSSERLFNLVDDAELLVL